MKRLLAVCVMAMMGLDDFCGVELRATGQEQAAEST